MDLSCQPVSRGCDNGTQTPCGPSSFPQAATCPPPHCAGPAKPRKASACAPNLATRSHAAPTRLHQRIGGDGMLRNLEINPTKI